MNFKVWEIFFNAVKGPFKEYVTGLGGRGVKKNKVLQGWRGLTLFEAGYYNYLFETGGELPYTLRNRKNTYIPTILTQNEVINMKFWNYMIIIKQNYFHDLWRHYDIIMTS